MGIGLGDLLVLILIGTAALCFIVGCVYATVLLIRKRFNRATLAQD